MQTASARLSTTPPLSSGSGARTPKALPSVSRSADRRAALVVADLVGQVERRGILWSDAGGRGPRGSHRQLLLTVLRYG
jgi:hypothetical protein